MPEIIFKLSHNSGTDVEFIQVRDHFNVEVNRTFKGGSTGETFRVPDEFAMDLRDALCDAYGLPLTGRDR